MKNTIAIQGQAGSFHDEVASLYFPNLQQRIYAESFQEAFDAVDNESAAFGISAIENSLAGSINQVYDLLLSRQLHIIGEHYLKITLCLLAAESVKLSTIKEVYSHPVALAQCSQYLDDHLPNAKRLEYHDTAAAAELVADKLGVSAAAIASPSAAALHSLVILAKNIEDNGNTHTRFIVFAKQPSDNPANNKTSLVLQTSHKPGALYEALGAFADNKINLSKLQSRPVPNEPWNYMFYIDVEAGAHDNQLKKALMSLREQGCRYTILGSYPAGEKQYKSSFTAK